MTPSLELRRPGQTAYLLPRFVTFSLVGIHVFSFDVLAAILILIVRLDTFPFWAHMCPQFDAGFLFGLDQSKFLGGLEYSGLANPRNLTAYMFA